LRMRNARQSGAASGSAQFVTHQVSICSRGGHIYTSYLGGPVATFALSRAHLPKCAMQGTPPPHSTQLVFSNMKRTYVATVGVSTLRISEAQSRHRLFEGPFGEMRNARRPTPAPRSALFSTHQEHLALHCERVKRGNRRGSDEKSPTQLPHFANTQCEAVRGRIRRC